jgi:MFS-type transporter involved in bile tolerance (Atg22 family)
MLGRVMGFYTAVAMTTSLLGIWFFGWVTQSIGAAVGLLGIGIVLLLVAATSLVFTKRMSHVKSPNSADMAFPIAVQEHSHAEASLRSARAASLMV